MKILYWSRVPGKFVNKCTGQSYDELFPGQFAPKFAGTVREWYETLIETCIDLRNQLGFDQSDPFTVEVGSDSVFFFETSVLLHSTSDDGTYEVCGMRVVRVPDAEDSLQVKAFVGGQLVGEIRILDADALRLSRLRQ